MISNLGNKTYLGSFDSEIDAARKYDEKAREFGKPMNFPVDGAKQELAKNEGAELAEEFEGLRCPLFLGLLFKLRIHHRC